MTATPIFNLAFINIWNRSNYYLLLHKSPIFPQCNYRFHPSQYYIADNTRVTMQFYAGGSKSQYDFSEITNYLSQLLFIMVLTCLVYRRVNMHYDVIVISDAILWRVNLEMALLYLLWCSTNSIDNIKCILKFIPRFSVHVSHFWKSDSVLTLYHQWY